MINGPILTHTTRGGDEMRKKGRRLIALMLVAATLFCMRSASGIV